MVSRFPLSHLFTPVVNTEVMEQGTQSGKTYTPPDGRTENETGLCAASIDCSLVADCSNLRYKWRRNTNSSNSLKNSPSEYGSELHQ